MQKKLNGILFGSTATGKTSLIRMLEDPTHVIESVSVRRTTTENVTSHIIPIYWEPQSTSYQLKIIDTPSLQEMQCLDDTRKNENIIEEIRQFLINQKITHLSFVGLVFNVNRISIKEIIAFKELRQFLGETLASRTFIIFTHCETKMISTDLNRINEQFCSNEMCRPLVEYAQLGRIYTGLLHSDLVNVKNLSSDNQTLLEQRIVANVVKMRNEVLEKILKNCTSVPIPEYWFERASTSSRLHTVNAHQPPPHIESNRSGQYDAASSMRASSQASQRQNGCCAKYFK